MNWKLKKEEIRKTYFSTGGLTICSILGIAGMLMVYFSGIFNVRSISELYDYFSKNGDIMIFGGFFFIVSVYCWILFILNMVIKPKKEILYLYEDAKKEIFFINKKGKRYDFDFDKNKIEKNNYYYVLKTHDYIYEVMGLAHENWVPKEKRSYWLNFYTPVGNFERIFLLPIAYVILLPGIFSIIMSEGYLKIYGIIYSAVPLYLIVYDFIYKIKLKQSNYKEIDEKNLKKSYEILKSAISITVSGIVNIIFFIILLGLDDSISKIIFLPFYGCAVCNFGVVLSKVYQNYRLVNLFSKGYIIIFLTYWFGILLFGTIRIIKEGSYMFGLFLIPFWIIGFVALYLGIIKKWD